MTIATRLAMEKKGANRPGLEEIRTRVQELLREIEALRKMDQEQRLGRQSQVPWDGEKQHDARVAHMNEIKDELSKIVRGLK